LIILCLVITVVLYSGCSPKQHNQIENFRRRFREINVFVYWSFFCLFLLMAYLLVDPIYATCIVTILVVLDRLASVEIRRNRRLIHSIQGFAGY